MNVIKHPDGSLTLHVPAEEVGQFGDWINDECSTGDWESAFNTAMYALSDWCGLPIEKRSTL